MRQTLFAALIALVSGLTAIAAQAQDPLRITVTQGVVEPLPYAVPEFVATSLDAQAQAQQIAQLIHDDLTGTGLFRAIPREAHISTVSSFDAPIQFADWKAINAQALLTRRSGCGCIRPRDYPFPRLGCVCRYRNRRWHAVCRSR